MPVLCDSKVWPSGFAAATNWAPTCPAAPALVSTTTGCLRIGSMAVASGRVTISLAPPGGNALTMVIACEGKASCANAGPAASALAAVAMRKRRRSMSYLSKRDPPEDSSDQQEYSRIGSIPQDRRKPRSRIKLTQAHEIPSSSSESRYHERTRLDIGRRLLAQICGYKVRGYKVRSHKALSRNKRHARSRDAIKTIRRGFDRSQRRHRAVGADAYLLPFLSPRAVSRSRAVRPARRRSRRSG